MSDSDRGRQQAENEKANGDRLGNPDVVKAAEKRLAALGGESRDEAPVEPQPKRSRQTKRA